MYEYGSTVYVGVLLIIILLLERVMYSTIYNDRERGATTLYSRRSDVLYRKRMVQY